MIKILQKLFLIFIRAYKLFLSPVLPPACRFYPTCSDYAYQAISSYGPFRGTLLAVKRILKCHPFHPGGIDHVP
ncbi:MAG: membrane protein insertion efficiency factor YidD [Deltaproteobacteria bacterium]|nr:membrane protein insertion efficiency factor YidD [Deltaproteobacteria bacterium]MBW1849616.1 membrane protein insertion efficiency factor YidD [Deltaproteobacteria bacterium]